MKSGFLLSFAIFALMACNSKPKVVEEVSKAEPPIQKLEAQTEMNASAKGPVGADVHQVVAKETLETERYTYILVTENKEEFWIAVAKRDIKIGNTYYYRNGLKKTDFYSQEFKRTFPVLYLVGNIIDQSEHPGGNISQSASTQNPTSPATKIESIDVPNRIKLSDLFKNKNNFNQKKIIVSGSCVKANYQIMNRNWFHIQDGSTHDGKNLDLTITSQDQIQVGDKVVFEGVISLQKDFGAGYKYEIIMEDAKKK